MRRNSSRPSWLSAPSRSSVFGVSCGGGACVNANGSSVARRGVAHVTVSGPAGRSPTLTAYGKKSFGPWPTSFPYSGAPGPTANRSISRKIPHATATRSRLSRRQASAHCPCARGTCARGTSTNPSETTAQENLAGRPLAVVLAPLAAQDAADLADRAPGAERLPHRHEHVLGAARRLGDARERRAGGLAIARRAHFRRARELAPLGLRVDHLQLDWLLGLRTVLVDADDHARAGLDLLLPLERRVLDLRLDEALLDRRHGAAELVDPLDQLRRLLLEFVGERLDVVRAAERIGRLRRARLVLQDLLRAQ